MKVGKEFKAGIIVILALLGFWGLFQFLKGKNLFSNQDTYYVKFEKVEGLSKSKNVNINGLKVGMVEAIIPIATKSKNLSFVVELKVDDHFKFSKNTVAQITSSFMNGAEVNLILAEDNALIAESGDTLKGVIQPGIVDVASAQLKPISANVNTVLVKLDSTLTATNKILNHKNRQSLSSALDNLNNTINEYNVLGKNMNGLIKDNSTKLSTTFDNTNKLITTTTTTMQKYGEVADKLNKANFDEVVTNLQATITNLNQITQKINSGEGSMGKFMNDPRLYDNLTNASNNLSLLLDDLKAHPKRYVQFSIFGKKDKQKTGAESGTTTTEK